jgi:hypothetical protein
MSISTVFAVSKCGKITVYKVYSVQDRFKVPSGTDDKVDGNHSGVGID